MILQSFHRSLYPTAGKQLVDSCVLRKVTGSNHVLFTSNFYLVLYTLLSIISPHKSVAYRDGQNLNKKKTHLKKQKCLNVLFS